MIMSKHTSTPQRVSNTAARTQAIPAPSKTLRLHKTWPISLCVGLAVGSIVFSSDALAGGPTGGVVVGGSGSIMQSGNSTVIDQLSNRLALNWNTFNLTKNESVLFNQPSHSAVALNRILDQNPSQIFGRINSNGQIFLINTHGIIFGSTTQLNVGGLMASTLDLTPTNFLAGNYTLNVVGSGAGIVNYGLLQAASGGSISLVGGNVVNNGVILANYGNINLDGADQAVLDFDGNGLINIQITGALKQRLEADQAAVTNNGTLSATSGTVVLQASAAKNLFTNLVNNTGVINASGINTDGGVVRLVGNGGNAVDSGDINVTGLHGGSVDMLSDQNVGMTGGSINASGLLGGGSVRIGGGWQGGEGLQTAAATYVAPDATIKADATIWGNGGSVVVWGNQVNNFYGMISARGGALGGNGGLVETSSHYGLNAQGQVNASAPFGRAGTWLLDPYNVTISNAASTITPTGTAPNDIYTATTTGSIVNAGDIGTALTNNTNVFVFTNTQATNPSANGDITVSNGITATGAGSLYLEAAGSIFLNAGISSDGVHALNVNLWANYGGSAAGTTYSSNASCKSSTACVVAIGNTGNASIATNGGYVDIETGTGGGAVTIGSATNTGNINTFNGTSANYGALTVNATGITESAAAGNGIVAGDATLNAGNGSISLANTTGNDFTGTVGLSTGSGAYGATLNNGANALTIGNSNVGSGGLTLSALDIDFSGTVNTPGTVSLTSTNDITESSGSISATTLEGSSGGSTNLNSSLNQITSLGNFTAAGFSLSNTGSLTLDAGDVLSGGSVTLNTSGNLVIDGTVTGTTANFTGNNGITLAGNVTTSGAQTYNDAVTLGGTTALTSTGNGLIDFTSTIDGGHALTVATGGAITFGGAVGGSTALSSLSAGGEIGRAHV